MNPAVIPPDEPMRQRRAMPWRGLVALGGLLLAGTFFLPAVSGCNQAIVPSDEVREVFSSPDGPDWGTLAQAFMLFTAAYLWGLLVAVAAILRLVWGSRSARAHGWGAFIILGLTAIVLIVLIVAELLDNGAPMGMADWAPTLFIGGVICPGIIAYALTAVIRLGRRAYLAVTCASAMAACAWFVWFVPDGYYGVRLSFAGSLVILVGIIGESATLTRREWFSTIWRLATCRLRDADIPRAACPKCQYDLRGAAEMRCPECGRPFSFDELGLSPQELVFQERLGAE